MKRPATRVEPTMIDTMKSLKQQGGQAVDILYLLSEQDLPLIDLIVAFQTAFGLNLRDVSCIGGWLPNGAGELNDEQVNALLEDAIQRSEFSQ